MDFCKIIWTITTVDFGFCCLFFKAKKKNLCLQKCMCPMALVCSDNTSQNKLDSNISITIKSPLLC